MLIYDGLHYDALALAGTHTASLKVCQVVLVKPNSIETGKYVGKIPCAAYLRSCFVLLLAMLMFLSVSNVHVCPLAASALQCCISCIEASAHQHDRAIWTASWLATSSCNFIFIVYENNST